jgi:hypothetical protein
MATINRPIKAGCLGLCQEPGKRNDAYGNLMISRRMGSLTDVAQRFRLQHAAIRRRDAAVLRRPLT